MYNIHRKMNIHQQEIVSKYGLEIKIRANPIHRIKSSSEVIIKCSVLFLSLSTDGDELISRFMECDVYGSTMTAGAAMTIVEDSVSSAEDALLLATETVEDSVSITIEYSESIAIEGDAIETATIEGDAIDAAVSP